MAFDFAALLSSASALKDALGTVFNRCEVSACAQTRNLSMGATCYDCRRHCCNAHGYVPVSAVPVMLQSGRPVVICQDCVVRNAGSPPEEPPR